MTADKSKKNDGTEETLEQTIEILQTKNSRHPLKRFMKPDEKRTMQRIPFEDWPEEELQFVHKMVLEQRRRARVNIVKRLQAAKRQADGRARAKARREAEKVEGK